MIKHKVFQNFNFEWKWRNSVANKVGEFKDDFTEFVRFMLCGWPCTRQVGKTLEGLGVIYFLINHQGPKNLQWLWHQKINCCKV